MNFVHHDGAATLLREHAVASTSHAVLIPSYNTGTRLLQTAVRIRQCELPVWVIIDGSTDGSGDDLASIAANDPDLHVCVLQRNQGKGAAILHGLRLAHARGFTHVMTMDADGQHSADHIETLIDLSRTYPEAMVLGVPVFDETAPAIRVAGHVIANFWANLVTLWSGIGDSLFGFRIYPAAALLNAFEETRWMRRFDFDSEAAIRLCWRGVPAINVPTPVRYFRREDGGVSHFKYLRDNILLVYMYARLLAEQLVRRFRSFHR
jgi:glycosyltransferase involved in cell wall biosynthesis